jgi:Tfp pilus assembly PilM family ATPase
VSNLEKILQDRFGTSVEMIDPFQRIEPSKNMSAEEVAELAPTAVVAVGLAMRSGAS